MLNSGKLDARLLVDIGDLSLPVKRTILRTDTLTLMMSAAHPLAAKKKLSLQDLEGQTVGLMSNPSPCFTPLFQAVQSLGLKVDWKIVPDFYEAGYRILQNNELFIDRGDNIMAKEYGKKASVSTDLIIDLPLEDDAFTLYCVLLTQEAESEAVRLLRKTLLGQAGQ